ALAQSADEPPPPPKSGLQRTPARELITPRANQANAPEADKEKSKDRTTLPPPLLDGPAPPLPSGPWQQPPLPPPPIASFPLVPTPYFTPGASRFIRQVDRQDNILEIIVGRVQVFNLLHP